MSFLLFLIELVLPVIAHAQGVDDVTGVKCEGFFLFCDLAGQGAQVFGEEVARRITTAIVEFLTLVTFIVIVWAAIQFIVGRGEMEKGKNTLYYAIGGYIAVRVSLWVILYVVEFISSL